MKLIRPLLAALAFLAAGALRAFTSARARAGWPAEPTDAEVIDAIFGVPAHFANLFPPNWAISDVNAEFTHKASEATSIGDLLWYDASNHCLRSAANYTDAGAAAPTQAGFAAVFAGVSNSAQLSTDATAENCRCVIDRAFEYPCVSNTFAVGDYVTVAYSSGLVSQQLDKTTDPALAIGRVVKEYQSATTAVKVRLTSTVLVGKLMNAGDGPSAAFAQWQQAQGAAPSAGSFSIFLATRACVVKGVKLSFSTASSSGTVTVTKDTGTTAPGGGTAILTGTMSSAGTANTVVSGTLVTTQATVTLAAGDRLAVTLAGTQTGLAGAIVTVELEPE